MRIEVLPSGMKGMKHNNVFFQITWRRSIGELAYAAKFLHPKSLVCKIELRIVVFVCKYTKINSCFSMSPTNLIRIALLKVSILIVVWCCWIPLDKICAILPSCLFLYVYVCMCRLVCFSITPDMCVLCVL